MLIAITLFDRFAPLDAVGPYQVLTALPGAEIILVAERTGGIPDSSVTSRGRSDTNMVFAFGSWTSTWNGPTASRAVKRSNRAMAISMMLLGC